MLLRPPRLQYGAAYLASLCRYIAPWERVKKYMSDKNFYEKVDNKSGPAKKSFFERAVRTAKRIVKTLLSILPRRGVPVRRFIRRLINRAFKIALLDLILPAKYRRAAKEPVDENKIVFVEVRLPYITNSFSVIFDELANHYDYTIHTQFLLNDNTSKFDYVKRCKNTVEDIATAKYVFVNEASNALSAVKLRPETKIIQLWHGCGAFKRFGFSTADLIFGDNRKEQLRHPHYKNYSLVTVSSPEVIWAYKEAMNIPESSDIVQALGSSRTDIFYDEEFISAAREKLYKVFPPAQGKKVILYAPTFRGRVARAATPDMLNVDMFYEHLGDEYVLLFKHHPLVKNPPKISAERSDFAVNVGGLLSIEELICVSDICISDYSSLVFEYSLFERPLIFFAYDLEEYFDWRGFYYDYYELAPGLIAKTNFEMIDYIENIEERFDKKAIQDFRYKFMRSCDGHSTQRILEYCFDDLEAHKKTCGNFENFHVIPHANEGEQPYFRLVAELKKQKSEALVFYKKAAEAEVKRGSIVALDIASNVIEYMLKAHGHDRVEFVTHGQNLSHVIEKIARAQYIVIDRPSILLDFLELRAETKVILLPLNAYPLEVFGKAAMEYRSGLKKEQYALAPLYGSVNAIVAASGESGEIFKPAVGEVELLTVGDLKTDALFDADFRNAVFKELYSAHPALAGRKIIAYVSKAKNATDDSLIYEYLRNDYVFIKCYFDSHGAVATSVYYKDSVIDVSKTFGVYAVLAIADIAVGDLNAAVLSFMASSKPVFIYCPNAQQMLNTENFAETKDMLPTPIYEDIKDVINGILDIENYDYTKYNELKEKYLKYCDGKSTVRLLSTLE